jgi:hypothetical protein
MSVHMTRQMKNFLITEHYPWYEISWLRNHWQNFTWWLCFSLCTPAPYKGENGALLACSLDGSTASSCLLLFHVNIFGLTRSWYRSPLLLLLHWSLLWIFHFGGYCEHFLTVWISAEVSVWLTGELACDLGVLLINSYAIACWESSDSPHIHISSTSSSAFSDCSISVYHLQRRVLWNFSAILYLCFILSRVHVTATIRWGFGLITGFIGF